MLKKMYFFFFVLQITSYCFAQSNLKIEPPFWWAGMNLNEIQLVVYGENISDLIPRVNSAGIEILEIHKPENRNYLFLDISIGKEANDNFEIKFFDNKEKVKSTYLFELKSRDKLSGIRVGVNSSDVIYLLMPDRYANGETHNDSFNDMYEKVSRDSSLGRHGGDIRGIIQHLDYIYDMGFTSIWTNPVLENNMYTQTYHGYAITDFYQVDKRLGSNEDYLEFIKKSHDLGLKIIMDMVFNHAGTQNYLVKDPPMNDWVHQWPKYTSSNYRGEVISDLYFSDYDYEKMNNGWFDTTMADLNQSNPYVLKYLIQNSIWWIEYAGIDAIRMDTYPYPSKNAMATWAKTVMNEYPNFTIIGEAWLQTPVHTSYWQKDACHSQGYNSHVNSVFDFPLFFSVNQALNEKEGWTEGWARIYTTLSQDMLYSDPMALVIFPDNHDVERFAEVIGGDIQKYKLAMAFYLTIRGIPQMYYGTEIMMGSKPYLDHGSLRREFPGGWKDSSKNAFTGKGLTEKEVEAQDYMKKLLTWRKTSKAIQNGKLKHFIPEKGIYVYARFTEKEQVVVILNKNTEPVEFSWKRYVELFHDFKNGVNVLTKETISTQKPLMLEPMSPLILEFKQ
jgi:glycosidase